MPRLSLIPDAHTAERSKADLEEKTESNANGVEKPAYKKTIDFIASIIGKSKLRF
jgi:hypothetical protein